LMMRKRLKSAREGLPDWSGHLKYQGTMAINRVD
jgi:hypothetical protein